MKLRDSTFSRALGCIVAVLFLLGSFAYAQRQVFQAQSMGQGRQMGQTFSLTLTIDEYSGPEDQRVLLEAFEKAGNKGLVSALDKMKTKGHIAITGTLGYDVSYAREISSPEGRKIRAITKRPVTFGEAWFDSRSADYKLTVLELNLSEDEKKNAGVLLPLVEFKVDKKSNELNFNLFQNPWKLVNVQDRTKK